MPESIVEANRVRCPGAYLEAAALLVVGQEERIVAPSFGGLTEDAEIRDSIAAEHRVGVGVGLVPRPARGRRGNRHPDLQWQPEQAESHHQEKDVRQYADALPTSPRPRAPSTQIGPRIRITAAELAIC